MIAALFVQTNGCYFNLPNVDPWDIHRDARKYAGPHPVVAHPPCQLWVNFAALNYARYGGRAQQARQRRRVFRLCARIASDREPASMIWRTPPGECQIGFFDRTRRNGQTKQGLSKRDASATPPAFRDALISLAESSRVASERAA